MFFYDNNEELENNNSNEIRNNNSENLTTIIKIVLIRILMIIDHISGSIVHIFMKL